VAHIQLSLFGKTSLERFLLETGWISEPCSNLSETLPFQCLLPGDGPEPGWFEGMPPTSHGGLWMPDIGEAPHRLKEGGESSSWRILEENVPRKYFLSPANCSRILSFAVRAGGPPPREIEYLLMKQGGAYPPFTRFRTDGCEGRQRKATKYASAQVSDGQMILSPLYLPEA
jgi:hypothetical protein